MEVDAGVDPHHVARRELLRARREREHGSPVTLYGPSATDRGHDLEHRVDGVRGRAELGDRAEEHAGERRSCARRGPRTAGSVASPASLIACAWRMHSSSSSVFVSFAGPSTVARVDRLAARERRPTAGRARRRARAAARERGRQLGGALRGLDLDRGVQVLVRDARAARLRGTRCRGAATARRARAPRPARHHDARMWSAAGTRAPVAYETLFCPHSSSTSTPAAPSRRAASRRGRDACARGRACRRARSRGNATSGRDRYRAWRSDVCRYTATRAIKPSASRTRPPRRCGGGRRRRRRSRSARPRPTGRGDHPRDDELVAAPGAAIVAARNSAYASRPW